MYSALATSGKIGGRFNSIWSYRIPPSIKVFLFLLINEKLLTREVMIRRQFNCPTECPLCNSGILESALHLFFQCTFAKLIWAGICNYLGCSIQLDVLSVHEFWYEASNRYRESVRTRRRWQVFIAAGCWAIWRQRNLKIFEEGGATASVVIDWIIREATLWEKHCTGTST